MRGSIRLVAGFLIALGSVGMLESDPTFSVLVSIVIGVIGIIIMYSGVLATMKCDKI